MKTYYVYMLRCVDGTFYVGMTSDVERRFAQHCDGWDKSCYTFTRRPLRLLHVSEFQWVHDAIDFEKRLKSWDHRKKRAFAEGDFAALKRYFRGPDRQRTPK
jgi:putative endonuclease